MTMDKKIIDKVLQTTVPGGSQVWAWLDGGGNEITAVHRRIAEIVIRAYIEQTTGKPIHQQEYEDRLT